jgi:hypothetical protein
MSEEIETTAGEQPHAEGPAGLRNHAKHLETDLKAERERRIALEIELNNYKRKDAFAAARAQLGDLGVDARLEDVADLSPEEVTPESLAVRAVERAQKRAELVAETAAEMGMTPEQYVETMKAVAQQKAQERFDMGVASMIAAGASALPPAPDDAPTSAAKAFKRAKDDGAPDDQAQADFIAASTQAQLRR